jgi:hypothetical protein
MTQPTTAARTALYSQLMWPAWNPRSESHGTSREQAEQLLNAYRAAVLREAADWLHSIGEREAAHQLRRMAGEETSR